MTDTQGERRLKMEQHLKVKEKSGESTIEQALLTGDIRLDGWELFHSLSLFLTSTLPLAYVLVSY